MQSQAVKEPRRRKSSESLQSHEPAMPQRNRSIANRCLRRMMSKPVSLIALMNSMPSVATDRVAHSTIGWRHSGKSSVSNATRNNVCQMKTEGLMRQQSVTVCALALLLAAGTLVVAGGAYANDTEKKGKAEMAAAAKVTIDEAIKTASDKVAGKVIEAELEKKHNKIVWEVEVLTAENKAMEVHIDADTGAVIDVEEEKAKATKSPKRN
jgi:uncharacterized membrane protein YkoI